jgi:hypothetical protein
MGVKERAPCGAQCGGQSVTQRGSVAPRAAILPDLVLALAAYMM